MSRLLKFVSFLLLGLTAGALAAEADPANLVSDPAYKDRKKWRVKKEDEAAFSSADDCLRIQPPGRYCALNQELKLKPLSTYRLSAEAQAAGSATIRVRARQADQKKGETNRGFDLKIHQSAQFAPYSIRFKTGPDGEASLIIGVTENSGTGIILIRNLKVVPDTVSESTGKAVPIPTGDTPTVITKLRVTDCRAVRGFIGAPVDGSLKSGKWNGDHWEYNDDGAGAGVGYDWHDNDGLHVTFADDRGFNAVVVRGGIKATLLRDCSNYGDSSSGVSVYDFPGATENSRAWFDKLVKTQRVNFFNVADGRIADCSFFRVTRDLGDLNKTQELKLTEKPYVANDAIAKHLADRFAGSTGNIFSAATEGTGTLTLKARQLVHFVSLPLASETPLAAIGLSGRINGSATFTFSIQDPLNPRLELFGADCEIDKAGGFHIVADFPDQIVPKGAALWITLRFDADVTLENPVLELFTTTREKAAPEALEHRKFLLKNFYSAMSEARPWNGFWRPDDVEKFFAKNNEYAPWVREIFDTLDQCRAIDKEGKDDIVRQYYQWIYRNILRKSKDGTPPFPTRFDSIDGVPEWAVLAHQAWMQAREVPAWWIENRMTPNGELGGEVGDDTDMFGNYAMFPLFESDGIGALVRDAAARLATTAEQSTLENGINKRTMDPLHAYEEGLNHEAQMLWWFYGDPIYTERCMAAAKCMEALTVLTPKGHRHFKSQECGAADLRMNRKADVDGQAHPQMWHPALELAWYNRNPLVMKMLREYGDGWLEHQAPGKYAHAVDVATETATETSDEPFTGGYSAQCSLHTMLADLTGDSKYIQPLHDYIAAGKNGQNAHRYLPELLQMEMLKAPEASFKDALSQSWPAQLYLHGDKKLLIDALKRDIEELQRFKHMYTTVECFTDRVFLYALVNPAIAYTGGFATRNKINQMHAVSWEGLGTDYAALVLQASPTHLKVLVCNLADKPLAGAMKVWRLQHGKYRLTIGTDKDGDDNADAQGLETESHELMRASAIDLKLPKKGVYVLELTQTEKLDDIFQHADLAIQKDELRIENGKLSGLVHNIGAKEVENVELALLDAAGKVVLKKSLGKLPAPLDLIPKTVSFELDIPADTHGWHVSVNAEKSVPEIYYGNNSLPLDQLRKK
jgi:hypothetical protein